MTISGLSGLIWSGTLFLVPDGENVATKVERNHKYTWAINGKVWNKEFDAIWPPIFSPDGNKMLLRCIENGKYYRRIIPVSEILG
ncbi:MAG: hypothetical protein KCCBMMGE_01026 [Candidatus Methanoperedenaceae archaeon GB37]|nr:hypothetical protein DMNBHIDG_01527 [Candidatus Methanoperedenaceae archaeon GB37]CAD7780809.1 MAG: hypothetical protein KCCBMMGE_01026 [Candidatus Methanoperedenaceae archaeon GB37]